MWVHAGFAALTGEGRHPHVRHLNRCLTIDELTLEVPPICQVECSMLQWRHAKYTASTSMRKFMQCSYRIFQLELVRCVVAESVGKTVFNYTRLGS